MSHRQAKRIRQVLRATGTDVKDRRYAAVKNNVRKIASKEPDEKGQQKMTNFVYTGTVELHRLSGRREYQAVKRGRA